MLAVITSSGQAYVPVGWVYRVRQNHATGTFSVLVPGLKGNVWLDLVANDDKNQEFLRRNDIPIV